MMSKEDKIKDDMLEDGQYFRFFSIDDLKRIEVYPNKMVVPNRETLKMQSDGSVALALLLKYLTNVENRTKTLIHNWVQKSVAAESKQMSADEVDKLSKILTQMLWGETTVEDAAYSSDDFITAAALEAWKKKAETELESVLTQTPAYIYGKPDAKLSKSDNAPAIRKQEDLNDGVD